VSNIIDPSLSSECAIIALLLTLLQLCISLQFFPGFHCDGFIAPRAGLLSQANSVADPLPATPLSAIACHRQTAEDLIVAVLVVTWI